MAKLFNAVGIVKEKNKENFGITFTNDLKKRLLKFQPFDQFERLDFVEIGSSVSKTEALQFMLKHQTFQSVEDQTLIQSKLNTSVSKDAKHEYKMSVSGANLKTNVSAEDILEAIK